MICGVECGKSFDPIELVKTADIIKPARTTLGISGNAQQYHKNIQRRDNDKSYEKDTEHPAVLEIIFPCGMGNALKAYKRPRGKESNAHDLSECAAVGSKHRFYRSAGSTMTDHRTDEADCYADSKNYRQYRHAARGRLFAVYAKQRNKRDDCQRNNSLS